MARKGARPDNLKQALAEATIKLIGEQGPLDLALSDVAEQARVPATAPTATAT